MSDDLTQSTARPPSTFRFTVTFGATNRVATFQEVSSLEDQVQFIPYRSGDRQTSLSSRLGNMIPQYKDVVLKRGIITSDYFQKWQNDITMNTIKREIVTIQLCDEKMKPVATWTLINAWPSKITGVALENNSKEVAIDSMALVHEGIKAKVG